MTATHIQIPKNNPETDSSVILGKLLKPSAQSLPICFQYISCTLLLFSESLKGLSLHGLCSQVNWLQNGVSIGRELEGERKREARLFHLLLLPLGGFSLILGGFSLILGGSSSHQTGLPWFKVLLVRQVPELWNSCLLPSLFQIRSHNDFLPLPNWFNSLSICFLVLSFPI